MRPTDFLPRQWYGEYVRESLLTTAEEAGESAKLAVVFDEVRRVARHPSGGWMVHLAREPSMRAEAVILTVGHRPPSDPIGARWSGPRTRFIADPWRPFAMNVVGPDEAGRGPGKRPDGGGHGALAQPAAAPGPDHPGLAAWPLAAGPRRHADPAGQLDLDGLRTGQRARRCPCPDPACTSCAARCVNCRRTGGDWRSVVDGLRPHTALLWRSMPPAERQRFLTRLRPFWEVHRHRMALAVAEQFRRWWIAATCDWSPAAWSRPGQRTRS